MQLPVQAGVLERGRYLPGDSAEESHVLAAQRLTGALAAKRKHRDRAVLGHTGHEVVEANVAPELDLLDGEAPHCSRVIQGDVVTVHEAGTDGRPFGQRRRIS